MVHCMASRPRRKGNSFSGFTWTMSFPENSRRPFPAPQLAPLIGKANAGKVVSVHYWPQETKKSQYRWTPIDQCDLLLQRGIVGHAQHAVLLFKRKYSAPIDVPAVTWVWSTRVQRVAPQSHAWDTPAKLSSILIQRMKKMQCVTTQL